MFKRGNVYLRDMAHTLETAKSFEQDESEINQQQSDQGLGINNSITNTPIHPKFMKQLSRTPTLRSSSAKKLTINSRFKTGMSPTNGDSTRLNFLSPQQGTKTELKLPLASSDVNLTVPVSPKFGKFSLKIRDLAREASSPVDSDKTSSIIMDSSPINSQKAQEGTKHPKMGPMNFKLGRMKTNTKPNKPTVTSLATDKVLDLIHDKAFARYHNEEKRDRGNKLRKMPTFGRILQKHIVKKDNSPAIFSLLDRVKDERKSRREKISDAIKKAKKAINKKNKELTEKFKNLIKPINPDATFVLIWEFILMLLLGLDLILLPFTLAFEEQLVPQRDRLLGIETWQVACYVIDILINMHTAYENDGNLVTSHKQIAKAYMMKFFWIDAISSYPYRWVENNSALDQMDTRVTDEQSIYRVFAPLRLLRFLRILRILRILKFKRIKKYLEQSEYFGPVIVSTLSLVKLSLTICFLAHWCACVWFVIGDTNPKFTWLEKAELSTESVDEQYVAALYFTLTTMLTVGYGDIGPVNQKERVFAIFMMLLGGGVFGYTMNSIALILQSLEGEKSKKKKKFKALVNYMERKKLNNDVKDRVKQYMKFKLDNEEANKNEDHHLLSMLSANLREEISKQINGKFVSQNEFFQRILTNKLKNVLHLYLDERIFSPHEVIYTKEDSEFSFYYVSKGKVEIRYERIKRPLGFCEKGAYFGQIEFFTGDAPTLCAQSLEFSHVVYLTRSKFLQILEKFPTDKETFTMIRDKIKLYNNYVDLQLKCMICEELNHITTQCPKTHCIFNQEDVVKTNLYELKTFQKNYERSKKRKQFSALGELDKIERRAIIIQEELGIRKRRMSQGFISADFDFYTRDKTPHPELLPLNKEDKKIPKTLHELRVKKSNYVTSIADEQGVVYTRTSVKDHTHLNQTGFLSVMATEDKAVTVFEEEPIDKVKNYEVYFPYNNITKILETMNRRGKKKTNIWLSPLKERNNFRQKLANAFNARKMKKMARSASLSPSVATPLNGKLSNLTPASQLPLVALFSGK